MRSSIAFSLVVFGLGASVLTGSAPAQDSSSGRDPQCLDLRRIRSTTVVDDRTLLFRMRNGSVYKNDLTRACPGLSNEKRFMYRVTMDRLCAIDIITVLEDRGFGFTPGASCSLGQFAEISSDEADSLLEAVRGRRKGDDDRSDP